MEKEKNYYVYADGMEYVSSELITKVLEQLDKLADECIRFSEGLWEGGDRPNSHFQEGQGKGLKQAIKQIGEIL